MARLIPICDDVDLQNMVLTFLQSVCKYVYNIIEFTESKHWHLKKYYCLEIRHIPYKFYVLGQIGLSKQCRPRSDCF